MPGASELRLEAGAGQGHRPDLVGGGLLRSHGGWKGVIELRKGREKYCSDERVLGSSKFIEEMISEAEKKEECKNRRVSLDTLIDRICREKRVSREAAIGGGRSRAVARVRAAAAYAWVCCLGRSGYELGRALGVSPQSLYAASSRIQAAGLVKDEDVERWCR